MRHARPTKAKSHHRSVAFIGALLVLLLASSLALGREEEAGSGSYSVTPVAIINLDDQGRKFKYPSAVFFDPAAREIYVLNNGRGRIIVYGSEFFPRVSLGAGRQVDTPNGFYVDKNDRLFVCQRRSADKPSRLTILNAAFFLEKEFPLVGFEEAEVFLPRRVTIGTSGLIYIAADRKGVVVMDQNGQYIRHLTPQDRVLRDMPKKKEPEEPEAETAETPDLGLPAELLPSRKGPTEEQDSPYALGAVRVIEVTCGQDGRLYLLSQETSKIYVYDAEEQFLFSFGEKGGSTGKMSQPRGMALDENKGVIYVVDYMRHTILVYDMPTGKYLFEFGGKGWAPGWFQYPTSLAVDNKGRLIVADTFNHRVQVLDVHFKTTSQPEPQTSLPK